MVMCSQKYPVFQQNKSDNPIGVHAKCMCSGDCEKATHKTRVQQSLTLPLLLLILLLLLLLRRCGVQFYSLAVLALTTTAGAVYCDTELHVALGQGVDQLQWSLL